MRYCNALYGSLNIERDRVQFCCATKQLMPTIRWNPDEELPLERMRIVRKALIKALNDDLDKPVPEYVAYGLIPLQVAILVKVAALLSRQMTTLNCHR